MEDAMSNYFVNLVRKLPSNNFSNVEKHVLRDLADYANPKGESIHPSINTIAENTSIARRTVIYTIKKLIERGYINKFQVHNKNEYDNNRYTLNVKKLEEESNMKVSHKKPVDNTVDKSVDNQTSSASHALGGSASHALGGSAPHAPKHHDHNNQFKHHITEGQQEMDFRNEIVNALLHLRVNPKDAQTWISKYGPHTIYAKLSEMKESNKCGKTKIRDFGAYLRILLEGKKQVA